jgi:hypothetical protein
MKNLDLKTKKPIISAKIAANNTAPAATSFVFLANGWCSGEMISVRNSMAVLSISVIKTSAIAKPIQHHSEVDRLTTIPKMITIKVANALIQALCCVRKKVFIP